MTIVVVHFILRKMKVRIKRLSEKAVVPKKAHESDAGFDLVATRIFFDKDGNLCYGTDLAFEIPVGYVGYVFPRSSNSKKDLIMSNCVGVVDAGYRGEVTFKFRPLLAFNPFESNEQIWRNAGINYAGEILKDNLNAIVYNIGDRIGQLIIMPIPEIEFEEADELSETDRGEGGYGSTGR